MNISSASNQNSIFGLTNQTNTSKIPLVRSVDPAATAATASKTEQEKFLNQQVNKSFIADQQAVALFEKNQSKANISKSTVNSNAFVPTDKDKSSRKNETAVASYQAVGNLAQRESVQQLFGVDIFA